tara:strand:+ start:197 stop:625 length:429 start_codon:yes stop_codon:yes gene_type:complete
MNYFEKQFRVLLEEPEITDLDVPAVSDAPEAPAPIDAAPDDVSSGTMDAIDDVQDNPGVSWRKDQNNAQRGTIESWVGRVGEFVEFLNGTEGSIQRQLADADCDTMFNDVSRSETKKITRIAQDLSALEQSLKGYLISNDDD